MHTCFPAPAEVPCMPCRCGGQGAGWWPGLRCPALLQRGFFVGRCSQPDGACLQVWVRPVPGAADKPSTGLPKPGVSAGLRRSRCRSDTAPDSARCWSGCHVRQSYTSLFCGVPLWSCSSACGLASPVPCIRGLPVELLPKTLHGWPELANQARAQLRLLAMHMGMVALHGLMRTDCIFLHCPSHA